MTELSRIRMLRDVFAFASPDITLGIGDDAAVLRRMSGHYDVVSVDCAVEDVHFRRSFASWQLLARRAFVAALSDLAAMGARPRAAVLNWQLSADVSDTDFLAIANGFEEAARAYGTPIVGGNLARSKAVSFTTTVLGTLENGPFLTRAGARPGDGIYVTGAIGGAALGLKLLELNVTGGEVFVRKWTTPYAQTLIGERLLTCATAAIDISDGLMTDLAHVCESSKTGARIYWSEIPRLAGFDETCRELSLNPVEVCLNGGEDYELIYCGPASETARELGTRIGEITENVGIVEAVDPSGKRIDTGPTGWQHF